MPAPLGLAAAHLTLWSWDDRRRHIHHTTRKKSKKGAVEEEEEEEAARIIKTKAVNEMDTECFWCQ
jgi:hypothetical protein